MRLTNEIRGRLVRALIEKRFGERSEKIQKDRAALGIAIYKKRFTKKERDLMDSLPRGWLPADSTIRACRGGGGRSVDHFRLLEPVPVPIRESGCNSVLLVVDEKYPKLAERWDRLAEATDTLRREKNQAEREAHQIIAANTSSKGLKEHWPEIADVVDTCCPASGPSMALVVPIARANELFGLGQGPRLVAK